MDLLQEAIVPAFLRKPIATCVFPGGGPPPHVADWESYCFLLVQQQAGNMLTMGTLYVN